MLAPSPHWGPLGREQGAGSREKSMAKSKRPHAIKMLFIGNSFTQRNNVPSLLAELASARGWSIQHDLISMGGASSKPKSQIPKPKSQKPKCQSQNTITTHIKSQNTTRKNRSVFPDPLTRVRQPDTDADPTARRSRHSRPPATPASSRQASWSQASGTCGREQSRWSHPPR